MRPGVDDGGVLMLVHDDQSWGLLALSGEVVYRNADLAEDDAAGACDWAYQVVASIADIPPARPSHSIPGVYCYHLQEHNGQVVADLLAGAVHYDGQAWVSVDRSGEVVDRCTDIAEDDIAAAHGWAHEIITSRPDYVPPRTHTRLGPDRRYFDYYPSADSGAARLAPDVP